MSKQNELAQLADAVTVDGSNVGIGTSSPSNLLHLKDEGYQLKLEDTSSGNTGEVLVSDTSLYFFSDRSNAKANSDIRFSVDNSERMRIDSSGNVGIGTSSPSRQLHISGSTPIIRLTDTDTNAYGEISSSSSDGNLMFFADQGNTQANTTIRFYVDASEQMRIDSSGNLLVAKTSTASMGSDTAGHTLYEGGTARHIVDGGEVMNIGRLNSDGSIIGLYKDGSTVGNISVVGDSIIFGRGDTALAFNNGLDAVYPINTNGGPRDNAIDLGRSNVRFDDIYATNGTIQTSDFNEKQDIASLTATEMLVGKRISALFKTFRWKDSVAENGDNARTHTGVIAQDVQAAFTAEGLDAGDYALFISNTWWEHDVDVPAVEAVEAVEEVVDEDGNVTTEAVEAVEAVDAYTRTDTYDTEAEAPEGATSKTRMGIRYPELLSFVAAYNEQRFASIEARLTALEA